MISYNFLNRLFILAISVILLAGCSHQNQLDYIPQGSKFVVCINTKKIGYKLLDIKAILSSIWADDSTKTQAKQISIDDIGIDVLSNLYVVGLGNKAKQQPSGTLLLFKVMAEDKFKIFAKSKIDSKADWVSDGGFSTLSDVEKGIFVGIGKDKIGYIVYSNDASFSLLDVMKSDAMPLISLSESFKAVAKQDSDLWFWVSEETQKESFGTFTGTLTLADVYGSCNFDDGKVGIEMISESIAPSLVEVLQPNNAKLNDELFDVAITADSIVTVAALNMNADALFKQFKSNSGFAMAEMGLAFAGTSTSMLAQHLSGQVIVAGSKQKGNVTPALTMAIGFDKMPYFDTLMQNLAARNLIVPTKNKYKYAINALGTNASLNLEDNYLKVVSGNSTGTINNKDFVSNLKKEFSGCAIGIYGNWPNIIKMYPGVFFGNTSFMKEMFFSVAGTERKKGMKIKLDVFTTMPDENSLFTIMRESKTSDFKNLLNKTLPGSTLTKPTLPTDSTYQPNAEIQ